LVTLGIKKNPLIYRDDLATLESDWGWRLEMFTRAFALLLGAAGSSLAAHADVIANHNGCTDPTTEGWIALGAGAPPIVPAPNCEATPGYWGIDDNSTGASAFYSRPLTPAQLNAIAVFGWRLSARLDVVSSGGANSPLNTSTLLAFRDATRGYDLWIAVSGADLVGKLITAYDSGQGLSVTPFVIAGGAGTAHDFALELDPLTDTASVSVDSVVVVPSYAGAELLPFVCCREAASWGAAATSGTGESRWNEVSIEVRCTTPPGDVNGDLAINLVDLATMLAEFGSSNCPCASDIDNDGDVDLADLATLLANFGLACA
jgi:hypothetical protein